MRWVINLSIKPDTTKFLEENMGTGLQDLKVGRGFLGRIQTAQTIKETHEQIGL